MSIPLSWLSYEIVQAPAEFVEAVIREVLAIRTDWTEDTEPLKKIRQELAQFVAKMQPGDRLYAYKSPPATWGALAGRAGYAVVRPVELEDSEVIATCTTMFS